MMQQRNMDPRLRTMSSSVFDLNQGNTMMRQPMMNNNNTQWMNNNMQQVRVVNVTYDVTILFYITSNL